MIPSSRLLIRVVQAPPVLLQVRKLLRACEAETGKRPDFLVLPSHLLCQLSKEITGDELGITLQKYDGLDIVLRSDELPIISLGFRPQ